MIVTETALPKEAHELLKRLKSADMIVGIPSYNNAKTIGHVVRAAAQGINKYFPDAKALLMNSDGGSNDDTKDAFLAAASDGMASLSTQYLGTPGKGSALKAIFEATSILGARVCVLVDSDLRSITPEWIRWLAGPILKDNAGYVTPLYLRHKYDGTITNSLAYPFTRALYGKRVRQPIGGDFGVAGNLVESYLRKDVWSGGAAKFGIDIFMTTTAIVEGFEIRQASLGAKIHDAKDPAAHLGPMFRQVVGTMFSLMGKHEDKWIGIKESQPASVVGPSFKVSPEPVPLVLSALIQRFKEGVATNKVFWGQFLSKDLVLEIEQLAGLTENAFRFPAQLWVRIVYEFSVAYNAGRLEPDAVIDSLTPLYFGRTAGFVVETKDMDSEQAEQVIEDVAELFEREKSYLVNLWKKR